MINLTDKNQYGPSIRLTKDKLETPALLIDLQALEFNLSLMSCYFQYKSTKLRPHFKTHKCPIIAKKQIEKGAIGITCAKISEAEILINEGFSNILIANQVVDHAKITRLAYLAGCGKIIVAVDQLENLSQISRAAKDAGTTVCVVVEVDVGLHRAGVQPGEDALRLAIEACDLPGLHFSGLLGYEGFTMFEEDRNARIKKTRTAMRALVDTSTLIQSAGIPVEIVSAGGTGTYDITGDIPGVTEIEAGSYVFMDTKYHKLGLEFKQSLTVLSMVTSAQAVGRCIIDSGLKVLSTDNGLPELIKPDGFKLLSLHEEHGIVSVDTEKIQPIAGTCVELVPSHSCTTVNLHDRYYVIKDDQLIDVWEISGRGKSQ